jgi:hypothetical protein
MELVRSREISTRAAVLDGHVCDLNRSPVADGAVPGRYAQLCEARRLFPKGRQGRVAAVAAQLFSPLEAIEKPPRASVPTRGGSYERHRPEVESRRDTAKLTPVPKPGR